MPTYPRSRSRFSSWDTDPDDWDDDFDSPYCSSRGLRRRSPNDWAIIPRRSSTFSYSRYPQRLPPLYTGSRRLLGATTSPWDEDEDDDWIDIDDDDELDSMAYLSLDYDLLGYGGGRRGLTGFENFYDVSCLPDVVLVKCNADRCTEWFEIRSMAMMDV